MKSILLSLSALVVLALAPPAFADPGAPPLSALQQALAAPAAAPAASGATDLFLQLVQACQGREWLLAVPIGLLLAIWFARKFLAGTVPWLASDVGGAVLALLTAGGTALAAAASMPGTHSLVGILLVAVPLFAHNEIVFRALKKLGIDLSVDPSDKPSSGPAVPPAAAMLLLCLLPFLGSCAFLKPLEPKLINCVTAPAGGLLKDVGTDLGKGTNEWQANLDNLAIRYGVDAVLCAIGVFVEALENPRPNGGAGMTLIAETPCEPASGLCPADNTTKLIRARAYLTEARARLQLLAPAQ